MLAPSEELVGLEYLGEGGERGGVVGRSSGMIVFQIGPLRVPAPSQDTIDGLILAVGIFQLPPTWPFSHTSSIVRPMPPARCKSPSLFGRLIRIHS